MSVYQNNTEALSQYIQSIVKIEELQKMTEDLDKELEDSQRIMSEIKSIFSTVPNGQNTPQLNSELRREQLASFLAADGPQMLMDDMAEAVDVDIETILAGIKSHAEVLKRNILPPEPQQELPVRPIENLNLEQVSASLDELSKRLANIKLNKAIRHNRNTVLEMKLGMLCEDVNNLTQAIQTKSMLTEANQASGNSNQLDGATALCYDNLIIKLLHSVNEATYIMKSNN
ncbi:uncharacterized protein LOC120637729 [Pararge aegeria]|uniref:Jg13057 protein n=2 Tax=Pararge aegeria TaxID=116150 RepID=A0A8S4SHL3_9NEOP|nr:uncharacterized protein LOC120637729 [Pararge aegeria]CAH2257664.1 jg13057 [Pararge aegeria aegeria]